MPIKWPSKYSKTTNRHNEWSTLKKKHAAAIKASKVDFDAGLGGAVDKFENMIKKVAVAGYGATATNADLAKVTQAGLSAAKVARDYKSKAGALTDPAKKELTAFLAEIEADAKLWDEKYQALEAYRHANWVADTHLKNDDNAGGKALTNTLTFTMTDLAAIIAAERGLVVV